MKDLDVIMPAWIRNDELERLTMDSINSIWASDGFQKMGRFIFIDNGSPRGGSMLHQAADIYIRNRSNIGYPAAINQGIKLSKSDYLAIANNDIKVSPNWLTIAREVFSEVPKKVKLGSLHYRMIDYDQPMTYVNRTWVTGKERWCNGSFFVIRRKVFDEVGLYDEDYGLGGYDDWDFQHRMRHIHKWKTAFTAEACFQHKHSSTLKTIKDREERDVHNKERFNHKFGAYAEDIWQQLYPKQMKEDYYKFLREGK